MPALALSQQAPAETTQVARQCLEDLETFNRHLIDTGFGVAGPRGYGTELAAGPYANFGAADAVAAPRGELRTVLTAAQIFAINGDQETCAAILSGAQDLVRARFEEFEALGVNPIEVEEWRTARLTTAVPVVDLRGRIQADDLIGADVRNPLGEDLGDIDDIVVGPDGRVQYALVSRGGFLGIGEDYVPVRWEDLSVTPPPYMDTVVLNVRRDVFETAPTTTAAAIRAASPEDRSQAIDPFWERNISR